jgi:outer membrane protein assembly factor BamA
LLRRRRSAGRRVRLRAAGAVVALLLGIPGVVAARSDLESQLKSVVGVELRGRHAVGRGDVLSALKTRPPSIWPWGERHTLRADFLRSDCDAIESLYRQHGYLDARVRDSLAQTRDPGSVRVLFLIEEGPCSRIAGVSFSGLAAVPAEGLRRSLYARPGRAFNPTYLVGDTAIISLQEGERGRLPRVVGTAWRDTLDSLRVHVQYRVDEGPLYRVGQVRLAEAGRLRVRERHVRRELLLRPGSPFRFSKVEESEERLYDTGYFSEVQITPQPDSLEPRMDFLVHVRERKRRWLDAGIGSGTQERLRLVGEWGSRSLGRQGLPGYVGSQLALDQHADLEHFLLLRGEASLVVPWLFGTRNRSQVTVYAEKRRDFRIDTLEIAKRGHGVTFQVQRRFGRRTYVRLTQDNNWVTDQEIKFLDPTLSDAFRDSVRREFLPSYSTHRVQLSGERDRRDSPLLTTRGGLQVASAEVAGGPFKGSTSFTKFQGSASWFTPLPRAGWVLATRVRGGVVKPFGERKDFVPSASVDREVARVPTEDVFRLGGVNSVRGYSENEIATAGGLALLSGNVELRVPVVGLFGLELYVDSGNVWTRPEFITMSDFTPRLGRAQLDAGDVRYVAGVGGRLNLAFAPVRLDLTWGSERGHRRGALQFAVGPSF